MLAPTVLRLSALVAASMSAGYLWRAAVDTGGTRTTLLVVPPAEVRELAQVPFNSLDLLRRAETEQGGSTRPRQVTRVQRSVRRPRAAHFVSVATEPREQSTAPAPSRASTHPAKAQPTKSKRRPKPTPPAPPAQPPPPAPPPPPPPVQPPPPPPVEPPPPPPPARSENRPGRGRGDRNHRHSGPPGQEKRKRGSDERGADEERGRRNVRERDKGEPGRKRDQERGEDRGGRKERERGESERGRKGERNG